MVHHVHRPQQAETMVQTVQPVETEVPRQQGEQPHQQWRPGIQQPQAEMRGHIAVAGDLQPAEQPQHDMAGIQVEHQIVPVDRLATPPLQRHRLGHHDEQHEHYRQCQIAHPISPLTTRLRRVFMRRASQPANSASSAPPAKSTNKCRRSCRIENAIATPHSIHSAVRTLRSPSLSAHTASTVSAICNEGRQFCGESTRVNAASSCALIPTPSFCG
ncbi:hypothetical protein RF55_24812 [Lasius niger]|uniref:Uncharacterized protein n=1 Tax=Lasius niger TaxID=67767 RepID=A0A0J7JUW8_LASNI|nr:hypothetical protein RF55_24812 [Lasius niger]